jgi:hypothetical protein
MCLKMTHGFEEFYPLIEQLEFKQDCQTVERINAMGFILKIQL